MADGATAAGEAAEAVAVEEEAEGDLEESGSRAEATGLDLESRPASTSSVLSVGTSSSAAAPTAAGEAGSGAGLALAGEGEDAARSPPPPPGVDAAPDVSAGAGEDGVAIWTGRVKRESDPSQAGGRAVSPKKPRLHHGHIVQCIVHKLTFRGGSSSLASSAFVSPYEKLDPLPWVVSPERADAARV
jgi:hypothetical protein